MSGTTRSGCRSAICTSRCSAGEAAPTGARAKETAEAEDAEEVEDAEDAEDAGGVEEAEEMEEAEATEGVEEAEEAAETEAAVEAPCSEAAPWSSSFLMFGVAAHPRLIRLGSSFSCSSLCRRTRRAAAAAPPAGCHGFVCLFFPTALFWETSTWSSGSEKRFEAERSRSWPPVCGPSATESCSTVPPPSEWKSTGAMVIKFAQRSNATRMPQHRQVQDCRGAGAGGLAI